MYCVYNIQRSKTTQRMLLENNTGGGVKMAEE